MAAKEDIRRSVARRMQTAGEQIAAAEQAAVRPIKDQAVAVAVAAAAAVMKGQIKAEDANRLIDAASARSARSCTDGSFTSFFFFFFFFPPPKKKKKKKPVESRKAQLEARRDELTGRLRRIDDELDEPVSERFEEQATEREDDEVLEDLGAAGLREGRMIEPSLDRVEDGGYGVCVRL